MKTFPTVKFPISLIFFGSLMIISCSPHHDNNSDTTGNWTTASDFQGDPRSEAVSFVIGDNAYVLTGASASANSHYNDMYVYNQTNGNWSPAEPLPADARASAVAFAINGKGYIGTGNNGTSSLKDFWEYDPVLKKWNKMDTLPGIARFDAVAFVIGGKAYVCGGKDNNLKRYNDFYEFDPAAAPDHQWTTKATFPHKLSGAVAFVLNNHGYIVTGSNSSDMEKEVYMYDVANNQWISKRRIYNYSDEAYDDKYTSLVRENAVAFVLGNYAYITTGINGGYVSSTWQYDAGADTWTEKTGFEASSREGAIAFTVNNRAFVLTGRSINNYFDNTAEFHPNDAKVDGD